MPIVDRVDRKVPLTVSFVVCFRRTERERKKKESAVRKYVGIRFRTTWENYERAREKEKVAESAPTKKQTKQTEQTPKLPRVRDVFYFFFFFFFFFFKNPTSTRVLRDESLVFSKTNFEWGRAKKKRTKKVTKRGR